jgi:hypothetical protein
MKVSTENANNFGNEKITIVVDNIPLMCCRLFDVYVVGLFGRSLFFGIFKLFYV